MPALFYITLILYIIAIIAPIIAIINLIKKGMHGEKVYIHWTILTMLLIIISWPYGLGCAVSEVITYMIARDKKEETKENIKPSPGSTADYERWKAEREQQSE